MEKGNLEEKYETKVAEFFDNYEDYIIREIIPESLAYYLKTAYEQDLLSKCPILNHLNSAVDSFNVLVTIDEEIISKVEGILNNKYNLKIENKNESIIVPVEK